LDTIFRQAQSGRAGRIPFSERTIDAKKRGSGEQTRSPALVGGERGGSPFKKRG